MNKEMPDNTIGGVINGYVEYLYEHCYRRKQKSLLTRLKHPAMTLRGSRQRQLSRR